MVPGAPIYHSILDGITTYGKATSKYYFNVACFTKMIIIFEISYSHDIN